MLYTAYLKYWFLFYTPKLIHGDPPTFLTLNTGIVFFFYYLCQLGWPLRFFPRIGRSNGADGHCTFSSMNLCYICSALFLALKLVQVGVINICQTLVCVKFRQSHKYSILKFPKFEV